MRTAPVVVAITEDQDPGVIHYALEEARRIGRSLRIVRVTQEASKRDEFASFGDEGIQAQHSSVPIERVTVCGDAATVLFETCRRAGRLVLSTDDLEITSKRWSDIARHVALHAQIPVIVLPRTSQMLPTAEHVLLAADAAHLTEGQFAYAIEAAEQRGTDLDVVFAAGAGSDYPGRMAHTLWLENYLDPWRARHPDMSIQVAVEGGQIVDSCLEASSRAALLVVGSPEVRHPRFGSRSVASRILHHARLPVAVVPPDYAPIPTQDSSVR